MGAVLKLLDSDRPTRFFDVAVSISVENSDWNPTDLTNEAYSATSHWITRIDGDTVLVRWNGLEATEIDYHGYAETGVLAER